MTKMNFKENPPPFEPGPALARIRAHHSGWIIDCRGPYCASVHTFVWDGDAAEYAALLRKLGGWQLRFSPSAAELEAMVDEADAYV